uniref:Uncharacterized protein n=1 Tax=Paraburkholderia sprentiae WSM5005 TaxID=754502 RepID=A0A1I9YQJ4_9BURK
MNPAAGERCRSAWRVYYEFVDKPLESGQLILSTKMRAQSSHSWLELNEVVRAIGQRTSAPLNAADENAKIANGDFFKVG